MANRNAKLIERTLKDFSLEINTNGTGGGAIVVDELPNVGEPNTIYELHEQEPPAYNWVPMCTNEMWRDNVAILSDEQLYCFIFDTYEEVEELAHTYYTWEKGGTDLNVSLCYVRTNDTLYLVWCDPELQTIIQAQTKISDYVFEVQIWENRHGCCILKSYEGWDETEEKYYGTLLNDNKVELGYFDNIGHLGFIPYQANFSEINSTVSYGLLSYHKVTTLPTAEEAITNYSEELNYNNGWIYVEIDGQLKANWPQCDDPYYFWDMELGNFSTGGGNIYTGPLQWGDLTSMIYEEIPYNDIINNDLIEWFFKPWAGGEKISYWIYVNGTWTNIDDIPTPSTSLGIICTEKLGRGKVNDAVDIFYNQTKLKIRDYSIQYTETGNISYAEILGLPVLNEEITQFELTICPKFFVDTSNDQLTILVNNKAAYQSNWQEQIPSEINITVNGISQIEINVRRLPL